MRKRDGLAIRRYRRMAAAARPFNAMATAKWLEWWGGMLYGWNESKREVNT